MAVPVTHADLEMNPSNRGQRSNLYIIFSVVLGLAAFVLSLVAETTRSQVIWEYVQHPPYSQQMRCVFSNSGKVSLGCAAAALQASALSMILNQIVMAGQLCRPANALLIWASASASTAWIRWQALAFFVNSWVCYAVSVVLLIMGMSMHVQGHTNAMRLECEAVRQGLFAGGGIFGLASTSLGVAFYMAALQTMRFHQIPTNSSQLSLAVIVPEPFVHMEMYSSPNVDKISC